MSEFGVGLKRARETQGVSLRQIATTTKISMSTLEALERADFSRLPGGIFGRAFVRAYAIEVGLDPDRTVEDFLVAYDQFDRERAARAPRPEVTADDRAFAERQRRAASVLRAIVIGLVMVGVAGVAAWQMRARSKSGAVTGQPSPAAPQAALPPPAAASTPAAPLPESAQAPVPAPAVATATVAREAADQVAVGLHATRDCWVRVTVDGNVQLEQVLRAADAREVRPGREVYVQVADAGSISWTINGKPAKDLGKAGEVGTARVTPTTVARYLQ
jgi:cytoskeletal protein RodZ